MNNLSRLHLAVLALLLLSAGTAYAQPTFINPIPIPPLIDVDADTLHLEIRPTTHFFNPNNPSDSLNGGAAQPDGIPTYAYNVAGDSTMTILGPTLRWYANERTVIAVKNLLGEGTTTHWHGAEVPPQMDGGPHQGIEPGMTWTVDFPVLDSACTMWYHPHYHNRTVQHVQMGLSGMILVEERQDPIRETLPQTYGVDDLPIIIGDLGFAKGSSSTSSMFIDTIKGKRPYNLVNGVTNPYVEVPAHLVRLRILNGSTRKGIMLGVSESYDDPFSNLKEFRQVATDGGYTLKPNTLTTMLNGPGERDEIVIDLSGYEPGDVLYLSNLKDSLPNSVIGSPLTAPNGGGKDTTGGAAFLELRIVADSQFPNYTPVTTFTPFTTEWIPELSDTSDIARHRLKRLIDMGADKGFTIDSIPMDMMVINDTVCVNTKEIWAVRNESPIAHPFHIHKIQFRILDAVDSLGNQIDLEEHGLNGPKDDVLVFPGWTLRFLGYFNDYPTPIMAHNGYMYHCHILTHEDSVGGGMMHQFVVTDEGGCEPGTGAVDGVEEPRQWMILRAGITEEVLYLRGRSTGPSTVTLIDTEGRRVVQRRLEAIDGEQPIDINGIPSGRYVVEWRTAEGVAIGKVMIVR